MPVPINVRECKREGTMRKGQSRETGNKVYTRYKKLQKKNKNKNKTTHRNMVWTPLCANKHK